MRAKKTACNNRIDERRVAIHSTVYISVVDPFEAIVEWNRYSKLVDKTLYQKSPVVKE
jgi:hypothetical protein